jgi:hypothetical protein
MPWSDPARKAGRLSTGLQIPAVYAKRKFIVMSTDCFAGRNKGQIRSALFWDITRRRVVIVYRRFGT